MVVYEFEMVERFLENSVYLDVPLKYLLLAKCHCLSMFALKIILKNVQMADVECSYVDEMVVKQSGKDAMILATQVAFDVFSGNPIDYLKTDEKNIMCGNVIKSQMLHPKECIQRESFIHVDFFISVRTGNLNMLLKIKYI